MKYWENGFYLKQNASNTRYELTDDEWTNLLKKQSEGYEIFDDNGQPKLRLPQIDEHQKIINEKQELEYWFDIYYSQHEQKYNRLIRKNLLCDDGSDPKNMLDKLDDEAEIKRKRIQELEKLI